MFKRFTHWLDTVVSDEVVKPEPLIGPEYFGPRRSYTDSEITPEVIIHNHLATQDHQLATLGHAMNRMYEELGELKGTTGFLKRLAIGIAASGITAELLNKAHWIH